LNCYSSPIFYKNSKRTWKIETTVDFKKEIGTQVPKRKSPVFLKRNIQQKEIQKNPAVKVIPTKIQKNYSVRIHLN
jgi:hypothetical protein